MRWFQSKICFRVGIASFRCNFSRKNISYFPFLTSTTSSSNCRCISLFDRVRKSSLLSAEYLKSILRSKSFNKMESGKPPNVLIFTGEDPKVGAPLYDNIASNLKFCLNADCYIIYPLTPNQAVKDPWVENTQLLVLSCDSISENVASVINNYVEKGGDLLNFCSPLDIPALKIKSEPRSGEQIAVEINYKTFKKVSLAFGNHSFTSDLGTLLAQDKDGKKLIFKTDVINRNIVFSEIHLELDPVWLGSSDAEFTILNQSNVNRLGILRDILSSVFGLNCSPTDQSVLTPCYLLTNKETDFTKQLPELIPQMHSKQKDFKMSFQNYAEFDAESDISEKKLPVCYNVPYLVTGTIPFNRDLYFQHLKTKLLGQNLFFTEVVGTTMAVIENLSDCNGAVAVARKQTHGRGRGQNQWISPIGSAMFSTHFTLSMSSILGQRVPIIQHLVALATVMAVRKTPGYEDIDLRLKWPNDIYYGSKVKIGGVLVNVVTDIDKNNFHIFTGCGLNVANTHPTLCLNDAIQFYNLQNHKNLREFSCEELIAKSLTEFEALYDDFQENGAEDFMKFYYSYWLHQDQKVYLEEKKEEVIVDGLTDNGFLVVRNDDTDLKYVLQPGGNSFDMMKNLITIKM